MSTATRSATSVEEEATVFVEAMSHLASGVVVVTSVLDGRPWGMTVSAACPVCTEPPTMLVSLRTPTALAQAIAQSGRYGVSVLGDGALEVARFASAVGQPKFLDDGIGMEVGDGHCASVAVRGALSHVDCDVVRTVEHGTHSIFLGRVRTTTLLDGEGPLLHYRRGFHGLGKAA